MSSVEYLREFVNERLTAAAEEIFGAFINTIVTYEEEIDRQRRLLDVALKPEIKLNRIEFPQQYVCKEEEEVLPDQQLCIQIREKDPSLEEEDPEPPQIKEEEEELCTTQEGEPLVLKQEIDAFLLTDTYEERDHTEPESTNYHTLLSHNSNEAENQDQTGYKHGESGSSRNVEPRLFSCKICGKDFSRNTGLLVHMRIHTGEKPHLCKTCGFRFGDPSSLRKHMRTHTGEKLFSCKICGKTFSRNTGLSLHMTIHTGEKPFSCKICGKDFGRGYDMSAHMRTHTGEKRYPCKICGKDFSRNTGLSYHMRIHTGEKPFSCKTCGKDFRRSSCLLVHIRRAHTGERPYLCKTCGKTFFDVSQLARHVRSHTGVALDQHEDQQHSQEEKTLSGNPCGDVFSTSTNTSTSISQ